MIKEISSYRFPGFYESIFCNSDEFIDDEAEAEFEIEELIGKKDFEVIYEYDNYDQYKIDVGKAYMETYIDKLIEILPEEITDNKDFKFDMIEKSVSVTSPKYYNYDTDHCYCEVVTNIKSLQMIKNYGLSLRKAKEYIKDHWSSRDGFISFIPNDINIWRKTKIEDYEENMLIALLDMVISLSDDSAFDEIKYDTFYEIDRYYYVSPIVYCGKEMSKKDIEVLKKNSYKVKTDE